MKANLQNGIEIEVTTDGGAGLPSATLRFNSKKMQANGDQYGIFENGEFTPVITLAEAMDIRNQAIRQPVVTDNLSWYQKMVLGV